MSLSKQPVEDEGDEEATLKERLTTASDELEAAHSQVCMRCASREPGRRSRCACEALLSLIPTWLACCPDRGTVAAAVTSEATERGGAESRHS